jgi:hypothetical protein
MNKESEDGGHGLQDSSRCTFCELSAPHLFPTTPNEAPNLFIYNHNYAFKVNKYTHLVIQMALDTTIWT